LRPRRQTSGKHHNYGDDENVVHPEHVTPRDWCIVSTLMDLRSAVCRSPPILSVKAVCHRPRVTLTAINKHTTSHRLLRKTVG
jgi:hypothetical protein